MDRFRLDMMVESQLAETHKTAPQTVRGVSGQGGGESNEPEQTKNCKNNQKKGIIYLIRQLAIFHVLQRIAGVR